MYAYFHGQDERFINQQPEPARSRAFIERAKYHESMAKWYSTGDMAKLHRQDALRLMSLTRKA